jgi:hypothetical protein
MLRDVTDNQRSGGTLISAVRVRGGTPTDRAISSLGAAFRPLGYEGSIRWVDQSGTRAHPWVIEVTLAAPFGAFFVKFSEAAGADAYQSLRAWIDRLRQGERERALILRIAADKTSVDIHSTVPDAALEALSAIDWTDVEEGTLEWDPSRRQWRRLGVDL